MYGSTQPQSTLIALYTEKERVAVTTDDIYGIRRKIHLMETQTKMIVGQH